MEGSYNTLDEEDATIVSYDEDADERVIASEYSNTNSIEPSSIEGSSSMNQTALSDFVSVENSVDSDNASETLAYCKKYIVRPFNGLLKGIGWRAFHSKTDRFPIAYKIMNIAYPIIMYVMLILACCAQLTTCFSRTKSTPTDRVSQRFYVLHCDDNLATLTIIPYIMILIAYPLALYTFRLSETEHLSSLAETAFLSFNDVISTKSRKKPFFILLTILTCGIGFFFISAIVSVCRLFALRLDDDTTIISWFSKNTTAKDQSQYLRIPEAAYTTVHYSLVILAYFGFLFFDMLYIAVTINYCSQCQLLTFYIDNVQDKVRSKKFDNLNLAIKEIHKIYSYLKILNGKVSIVTSLIFFIFVSNAILSYSDLVEPDPLKINTATGFLNTIQWLMGAVIPVMMAARLTASGNELRRLGQEIAARPFYYSGTPDLELQFFLTFTESTRYQVNLAFIPMQPSLVLGIGFFTVLCFSSGIIIPTVRSVTWF